MPHAPIMSKMQPSVNQNLVQPKLLMILVKNLYFWHEINTFLIHKIIWAQMKTCYNLPVRGHQSEKNILVEGFLKNTYMNPLLKLGKT
jgi:hypothetical protein